MEDGNEGGINWIWEGQGVVVGLRRWWFRWFSGGVDDLQVGREWAWPEMAREGAARGRHGRKWLEKGRRGLVGGGAG